MTCSTGSICLGDDHQSLCLDNPIDSIKNIISYFWQSDFTSDFAYDQLKIVFAELKAIDQATRENHNHWKDIYLRRSSYTFSQWIKGELLDGVDV